MTFARDPSPAPATIALDASPARVALLFSEDTRPPLIGGYFDQQFFDPRLFHLASGSGFVRDSDPVRASL